MSGHDIIVIGASAGGVEALKSLVAHLPADLPAALFIVLHTPADGPGYLAAILDRAGPLPSKHAEDGEAIERGRIYVARPDYHLLLELGRVQLERGPKENRSRPAIDPLFRSAAMAYGPRVIGVILTGGLDDGTAGLLAVKKSGGIAIVQDPADALFPDMPQSASDHVRVDFSLPLVEIPAVLTRLTRRAAPDDAPETPEVFVLETQIARQEMKRIEAQEKEMMTLSPLGCPECGGVLWQLGEDELLRFRCHVGHAYTANTLLDEQAELTEGALWKGVRVLEDRVRLLDQMADRSRAGPMAQVAAGYEAKARALRQQADTIRQILYTETESPAERSQS